MGLKLLCIFWASLAMAGMREAPAPLDADRQDVARETFEFLRLHALKTEEDPFQWVYDGAYELDRAAKQLYDLKVPLNRIQPPVSVYSRGGYEPYVDPLVFLQHESLVWRIDWLINYGKTGIPPQRP